MNIDEMISNVKVYGLEDSIKRAKYPMSVNVANCTTEPTPRTFSLGNAPIGSAHDHFLNGIIVQFDLTFTPKMSVELERYHWVEFISSQSTMHKITQFDLDKAYISYVDPRCIEVIKEKVAYYNKLAQIVKETCNFKEKEHYNKLMKQIYLEILYSNPCGMLLTAGISTNYLQLKTIYNQRRNHRLPEWQTFCDWVETLPMFKELCLEKKVDKPE